MELAKHWDTLSGSAEQQAWLRGYFLFNLLLVDRTPEEAALNQILSVVSKAPDHDFEKFAPAYFAIKRGDYATAIEQLGPPSEPAASRSTQWKQPAGVPLPYLTLALLRSAQTAEAETLLRRHLEQVGRDFHYLLAAAYLEGSRGRQARATELLWEAFVTRPGARGLSVPPGFQLLESCEHLLQWTGDERYRTVLVELARRMQRVWPDSWAYAFAARHERDAPERERALALALYLDPQSEHLKGLSEAQRKRAEVWLAANNPFTR